MAVGHTVTACGANIRPNLLVSGGGCEETGTQIVIFGNRRGFSPVRMSTSCLKINSQRGEGNGQQLLTVKVDNSGAKVYISIIIVRFPVQSLA